MQIIGLVGLIGAGKDTVADILVNHGYQKESFARSLKDVTSSIFGWNRELLNGTTEESRVFRERVDDFWSGVFSYDVTPRNMLQRLGTEVLRDNLHNDVWVYSLINRIQNSEYNKFTISDVRFPNEIHTLKGVGAKIYCVKRGPDPIWYNEFIGKTYEQKLEVQNKLKLDGLNIHASEWAHIGIEVDGIIENDSTLEDLRETVQNLISD